MQFRADTFLIEPWTERDESYKLRHIDDYVGQLSSAEMKDINHETQRLAEIASHYDDALGDGLEIPSVGKNMLMITQPIWKKFPGSSAKEPSTTFHFYTVDGVLHREGGPAVLSKAVRAPVHKLDNANALVSTYDLIWFKNGVQHRDDGPSHIKLTTWDEQRSSFPFPLRNFAIFGKRETDIVRKYPFVSFHFCQDGKLIGENDPLTPVRFIYSDVVVTTPKRYDARFNDGMIVEAKEVQAHHLNNSHPAINKEALVFTMVESVVERYRGNRLIEREFDDNYKITFTNATNRRNPEEWLKDNCQAGINPFIPEYFVDESEAYSFISEILA